MKKIISLVLIMAVIFTACGDNPPEETAEVTKSPAETSQLLETTTTSEFTTTSPTTKTTTTPPHATPATTAAPPETTVPFIDDMPVIEQEYGSYTQKGDWLYYTTPLYVGNGLYKENVRTGEKVLLDSGIFYDYNIDINVVGNWVYYAKSAYNTNKLYKIQTDGFKRTTILDFVPYHISVVGDWLYYSNNEGIFKIRTDGTDNTFITNNRTSKFFVLNNWIYHESNKGLSKIRVDGEGEQLLVKGSIGRYHIDGEWLYYVTKNDILHRIKLDGTDKKAYEESVSFTSVNDGLIYGVKSGITIFNPETLEETTIGEENILWVNSMKIFDEWIYFTHREFPTYFSRIKKDGTDYEDIDWGRHYEVGGGYSSSGIPIKSGEWTYITEGNSIYRIRGDEVELVTKTVAKSVNDLKVVDDWVYYGTYNGLYKVRPDGTGKLQLSDGSVNKIAVVGGYVYSGENSGLYDWSTSIIRISDRAVVSSIRLDYMNDIVSDGEFVYYRTYDKLYKIKAGEYEPTPHELLSDYVRNLRLDGDWIYYINGKGFINRINTKTEKNELIFAEICDYLSVENGYIYFNRFEDDDKLYRIRTDGSGLQKLTDDKSSTISVCGDFVYYYIRFGGGMHRIRTDGTGKESVQIAE